ncbi:hypothetical protein MMPV_002338 [Pyropia vietnamensis]
MRIGHGYDLHRLEAGRPLILGGVHLPHSVGCAGHSDGDAVYHCVVDGLLGALSEPDIGQMFPDTDPRFAGAASDAFVRAAAEVVESRGYAIANLDVTVLLERPKVSPVKAQMRSNIAACLGIDVERVNLKAKTGEKVDAVGEGRAVAVHAVVLLTALPEGGGVDDAGGVAEDTAELGGSGGGVPDSVSRALGAVAAVRAAVGVPAPAASTPASRGGGEEAPASLAAPFPPPQASSAGTPSAAVLDNLAATIASRRSAPPTSSWTAKLLSRGVPAVAQKVGEEATEVVIEAVRGGDSSGLVAESADLLYHLLVLWEAAGVRPGEVWAALAAREGVSGVAEKAARKAG